MVEERIATLETEVRLLKETNKELLIEIKDMKQDMTKYKGFLGGIIFVGGCMWTFLSFVLPVIAKKLGF